VSGRIPEEEKSALMQLLERLDHKVEKLDRRLDNVDKTLIKQEGNLEKHILRTDLAERNIEMVRTEVRKVESDLAPVKKHVVQVEGALKLLGLVLGAGMTLVGAISSVIKLLSYFQK
jgi:archaellum component FlaC